MAIVEALAYHLLEAAPFMFAWWALSRVRKLEKRLENNPCFTE